VIIKRRKAMESIDYWNKFADKYGVFELPK